MAKSEQVGRGDLITIETASAIIGRSVRTLRYWEAAGNMPPRIPVGKQLRYLRSDILLIAKTTENQR